MAKLSEIAIFTERVDAILRFYCRILGSDPERQSEDGGQLASGGVKILVHRAMPDEPGRPPNESHLAFSVADLDVAVTTLTGAGMTVVAGPATYDWGRSAYFRDPDGRLVEVTQA